MFRRTALTVGLVAACLWCLLLVARADSAVNAKAGGREPYRAVAPVQTLMRVQDHHLGRIAELLAADEVEDRFQRVSAIAAGGDTGRYLNVPPPEHSTSACK